MAKTAKTIRPTHERQAFEHTRLSERDLLELTIVSDSDLEAVSVVFTATVRRRHFVVVILVVCHLPISRLHTPDLLYLGDLIFRQVDLVDPV